DPAIVEGTRTSITIITYTDAGPSFELPQRLRYSIDAQGRMREQAWRAQNVGGYAVFPAMTAPPDSSRVLGNGVVNTAAEPLFRYFDVNGIQLGTAGTLSAAERAAVTSVRFYVKVRSDTSKEVVVLDNKVGMPNMDLGLTEG